MKLSIEEFAALAEPAPTIIHSLDQALYQVTVVVDGRERLLVDETGRPLRRHSLNAMREVLQTLPVASLVLRQRSAYDEMIGQPPREGDNLMELPLTLEDYPPPVIH